MPIFQTLTHKHRKFQYFMVVINSEPPYFKALLKYAIGKVIFC